MQEREVFNDNLLVRIHFVIVMIRWTGLAPCEFEFPFPGSLTSTPPNRWVTPVSGAVLVAYGTYSALDHLVPA